MADHFFFHTSGHIIKQPQATDTEIAALMRLVHHVADTATKRACKADKWIYSDGKCLAPKPRRVRVHETPDGATVPGTNHSLERRGVGRIFDHAGP